MPLLFSKFLINILHNSTSFQSPVKPIVKLLTKSSQTRFISREKRSKSTRVSMNMNMNILQFSLSISLLND